MLFRSEFKTAARNEVKRREASARVQLIKEALWLEQNGIKVTAETFPTHYEALHGKPVASGVSGAAVDREIEASLN